MHSKDCMLSIGCVPTFQRTGKNIKNIPIT